MLSALPRVAVLIHVFLIAAYLAWARGGTRADLYGPLPWLALGLLELVILFPPVRREETDGMARRRVVRAILRDPVFYLGLALMVFLGIQWMNGPRALTYDAESGSWSYSLPPLPSWPFSVAPAESCQPLYWFGMAYAAVLAVRHGLSRRAKTNLLRLMAANGALLALFGAVQMASGTQSVYWYTPLDVFFFASFGYPNHGGAFFVLMFCVSGGLLLQAMSDPDHRAYVGWMAAALILNLTGVVLTLSRGAILLSAALLVAGMIYAFTFLWPVISGATKLRTLVVALLVAGVAAFLFFAAYPQNAVRRELATLSTLPKLREAFVGDRVPLFDAAWRIWKDHPWAGVGGWGFRRFAGLYLKPDEWDLLRKHGKANVHNDPLQFLCEHGVVGMGLILATAVILIVPIFMRLKAAIRPPGGEEFAEKPFIIRVSPLVWALMGGTFCVFLYSLVDLPFRSPAVLYPWAVCLATASGMIPRLKWRAAGADASRRARHVERGASGAGDEGDGEESRRSRADEA